MRRLFVLPWVQSAVTITEAELRRKMLEEVAGLRYAAHEMLDALDRAHAAWGDDPPTMKATADWANTNAPALFFYARKLREALAARALAKDAQGEGKSLSPEEREARRPPHPVDRMNMLHGPASPPQEPTP